jgi:hypothetical protein
VSRPPDRTAENPIDALKHTSVGDAEPVVADWGVAAPNRIMVMLAKGAKRDVASKAAETLGGEVVGEIGLIGVYVIGIKPTDAPGLERAVAAAEKVEGVELATPDLAAMGDVRFNGVSCSIIKDDKAYAGDNARPYEMIGVERAWAVVRASGLKTNVVKVGVADSAIYKGQGEFGGDSALEVTDAANDEAAAPDAEDGQTQPYGTHGTAVAGIIGADPDNGGQAGVSSVLGKNLKMIYTRVIGGKYGANSKVATDASDPTQLIEADGAYQDGALVAMLEQVKKGATVINMSWGVAPPADTPENRKMARLYRRFFETVGKDYPKVVFVCSAGNDGLENNGARWPSGAPLPNVVTVGCLENDGSKVDYSNTGSPESEVSIAAPGHRVVSGVGADGTVGNINGGTSFAAPQVTSAIAILQSLNPGLTAQQIKQILRDTMTTEFKDRKTGVTTRVPEGVGGGCVAVDRAALKVVNDMRRAAGMAPLTMDNIDALNRVELAAEGVGAGPWNVVASLKGPGTDTNVAIRLTGEGVAGGEKSQAVKESGSAKWDVTVPGDPAVAHVERSDTGACSRVKVGEDPWVGVWRWTAWYGFKFRMTVKPSGKGYAGKTNTAVKSVVKIKGNKITIVNSFRDMFGTNTQTWTGHLKDGVIVGTFVAKGSSGTRKKPWRATKVK